MMKRTRHTPEQVIRKLRDADRMLAEQKSIAEIAQEFGVSENTYQRWRNQYGGMKADDVKKLKELERENARLRTIVADQALQCRALKEVARGRMKVKRGPGRSFPRRVSAAVVSRVKILRTLVS